MFTVTTRAKERVASAPLGRGPATRAPHQMPTGLWLRGFLAVSAGVILAASLAVIGAPSWISLTLGACAALRVAASGAGATAVRRR